MSRLVYTSAGLVPRESLEVKDVITETAGSRDIATEWYLNGELVRRDGWANLFQAQSISGEQAQVG